MRRYGMALMGLLAMGCDGTRALRAGLTPNADANADAQAPSALGAVAVFVNSTTDAADAMPGDGICATANAQCTLRAANMEANVSAGPDTIVLAGGEYLLTVPGAGEDAGATADLDISDDLTILGAGASRTIIDGNGRALGDRVLHVTGAVAVTLSELTIRGGHVTNTEGGGIFVASGALLALSRSAVTNNTVINGNGGGIRTDGGSLLVIARSSIRNNTATGGSGGGISSGHALRVTQSTFSGNTALNGGAISTFPFSTLTIESSTLDANTAAGGYGGGINNLGAMALTNSTVSGNTAGFNGGGVSTEIGSAMITNSTINGNAAGNAGGGLFFGNSTDATTLRNTLIVGSLSGGNCAGAMTDDGGNVSWPDVTCPGVSANPLLGALALNGGPTRTHAVAAGSPAIDAALLHHCPTKDQRGERRPRGQGCDVGAFER